MPLEGFGNRYMVTWKPATSSLKEIYEFYKQFGLLIHQSAIFIPTPHPNLIRLVVITANSSIYEALSGYKKYFNHQLCP